MRYLEITGGIPLGGEISVQGSKNAVLPVLTACILGEGVCVIENCPDIRDVEDLLAMMKSLGCVISREGSTICVDAKKADGYRICGKEPARIRSSILFLGALLGKMGKVELPLPGGCAIGCRPIDLHLYALEALGAEICVCEGYDSDRGTFSTTDDCPLYARAAQLSGNRIRFPISSVGATENAILAAVTAMGETVIENAALEPEVDELCRFLNMRGADICRMTDGSIRIRGVRHLHSVRFRMCADRIVSGTYLLAAAATGGSVAISNFPERELGALVSVLEQAGAVFASAEKGIVLQEGGLKYPVPYLETAPYPGFPTDLQSLLMAALCRVRGNSCICEKIFENRFATVIQLGKMGAQIERSGECVCIRGVKQLHGAVLQAPDLRGGAALVVAALQACGCSRIANVEYIERGYEDISRDLRGLGARIRLREE